jgi:hypothetical protein
VGVVGADSGDRGWRGLPASMLLLFCAGVPNDFLAVFLGELTAPRSSANVRGAFAAVFLAGLLSWLGIGAMPIYELERILEAWLG